MAEVTKKIFWKNNSGRKDIVAVDWDKHIEYYDFVRQQAEKGLYQVAITSEMMIGLITDSFDRNWRVYDIEIKGDEEIENDINALIDDVNSSMHKSELMGLLATVAEQSSVGIKKIKIYNRESSGRYFDSFICANGVVGFNGDWESMENETMTFFDRYFNR